MKTAKTLLSLKELEAETGIAVTTWRQMVAAGDLACVRIQVGPGQKRKTRGRLWVKRSDFEDWVERHRTPATAPTVAPQPEPPERVLDLPGATRYLV